MSRIVAIVIGGILISTQILGFILNKWLDDVFAN